MTHNAGGHATNEERNQDATCYIGHLDEKVTDALLWELFLQAGPVQSVFMPKDRVSMNHQGYGFVEFLTEEDADYAIRVLNMIKMFGKPIRVNKASTHNKNLDVGANIFIGNLDPEVDEKLLYDTFSAFGVIMKTPKIMRDPETGTSKGFAFVNFATFEAADTAMEAMSGQFLCNRAITISFAFKRDGKGERHGSAAERLLASQNPLTAQGGPNTMFSDAAGGSLSQTVPSAVQQALPPSLGGPRMRMGGPRMGGQQPNFFPGMNRPPPPGIQRLMRPPPPGQQHGQRPPFAPGMIRGPPPRGAPPSHHMHRTRGAAPGQNPHGVGHAPPAMMVPFAHMRPHHP